MLPPQRGACGALALRDVFRVAPQAEPPDAALREVALRTRHSERATGIPRHLALVVVASSVYLARAVQTSADDEDERRDRLMTTTNRLANTSVATLAELNVSAARDFATGNGVRGRSELRVGRYGLQYSTTGYGVQTSQGSGGNLLHVVMVSVITALDADFDVAQSCRSNAGKFERANPIYAHGGALHRTCNALKVGDIVGIRPVCVDQNARGVSADVRQNGEDGALDTDSVNCRNCLTRRLGVAADVLPVVDRAAVKAENAGKRAAAAAAKPRCPNCGFERPKSKATERGERPLCSNCAQHVSSAKYFWECGDAHGLVAKELAEFNASRTRALAKPERAQYVDATLPQVAHAFDKYTGRA